MRVAGLSLLVLILAAAPARAQAPPPDSAASEPPIYRLEGMAVTVTRGRGTSHRVPRAVDVVGTAEIQRATATLSLEESLRHVPGIEVDNRHNFSLGDRISIRGVGGRAQFGVRGIKVLVDGIPLTMADGQTQLSNLDLGSAGRIEVIRGPSSSLYGNAAGGVVQVETEPGGPGLLVEPKVVAGDFGLRKFQGKVAGSSGRLSYIVNASRTTVDGFRDHSGAELANVNAVVRVPLGETTQLTGLVSAFDSPFAMNPSSLDRLAADSAPASTRAVVERYGAGEKTRHVQAGMRLLHTPGAGRELEVTVFGMARAVENPLPGTPASPGRLIDLDRRAGGLRATYRADAHLGAIPVHWTVGADVEAQADRRAEFDNLGLPDHLVGRLEPGEIPRNLERGARLLDQDEAVLGLGPFASVDLSLGERWLLTLGARYDVFRFDVEDRFVAGDPDDSGTRTMDQLSPMVGLSFRAHPSVHLYGNIATTFQTPTTSELSNRPTGAGGFNPELEPERLRSVELGVKGAVPEARLAYAIGGYAAVVRDAILPFQLTSDEVFFRNAGRTRTRGLEASATWEPVEHLAATASLTIVDAEFEDFTVDADGARVQLAGNRIPGVAPRRLFLGLAYDHPSGVFAEVDVRWTDETFANDFNGPPPGSGKPRSHFVEPAHTVADLSVGFRRAGRLGIAPFLRVNNVFDERYSGSLVPNAFGDRFFEPAPGRHVYFGIAVPYHRGSGGAAER